MGPRMRFFRRSLTGLFLLSVTLAVLALAAQMLRGAIEERIALELGFDIGDKIEIGELKQLDRLHQLRGHHQQLALTEL